MEIFEAINREALRHPFIAMLLVGLLAVWVERRRGSSRRKQLIWGVVCALALFAWMTQQTTPA